jgi:hypothetical protein
MAPDRWLAGAAGLAGAVAIGCLVLAAARTPGFAAVDYVSELGVGGGANRYRAGVLVAAVGVAMFGLATRRVRLAGGLLGASALLFVSSATVTCTPGCPLPPYDPDTTVQDVLHAGASAGALGCAGLAMLVLAARYPDRLVAAVCGIAGVLVVALMALTGIALLVNSKGLLGGLLERGVIGAALSWLSVAGTTIALRSSPDWSPCRTTPGE